MNILYICHRFPFPPKRGGKIRPFNMISHLSKQHKVTVASLVRSQDEANEGKGLADYCAKYIMQPISGIPANLSMILRLPSTRPSSFGYFYSSELKKAINREIKETAYDLIFVHCSSMAPYVEDITEIPKIIDFGDMDSQKWLMYAKIKRLPLSLGYLLEGTKLENEEKRLALKFDFCTCTTKAELKTLLNYKLDIETDWFPNGVDTDYFKPNSEEYKKDLISFVGRMDYYPNQEAIIRFCNQVLPILRQNKPEIKLVIVGANPSKSIRSLGKLSGVKITGSVPEVRPYLWESCVNIAPLNIARGTQNKILESLALGVPVICSELAAQGVDVIPGEHLITASSPNEYANAILSIMDSKEKRQTLAKAGRNRVLTNHSWSSSMKKLDGIINRCLANKNNGDRR